MKLNTIRDHVRDMKRSLAARHVASFSPQHDAGRRKTPHDGKPTGQRKWCTWTNLFTRQLYLH